MTIDEAIEEDLELDLTFPIEPCTPDEEIRAQETCRRKLELFAYIFKDGPEPAANWKPSVPSPTGAERDRHKNYWLNVFYERNRMDPDETDA